MKAARNALTHEVRFTEATTVLWDRDALSQSDEEHSEDEERYAIIGRSLHIRTLFVVHVVQSTRIRIISARQATPKDEFRELNLVSLKNDVKAVFSDSKAVNAALRTLWSR